MNVLSIAATKSSPNIHFDPTSDKLHISGESYPENCNLFYQPMFAWLQEYLQAETTQRVTLDMEIIYFNSSSSKIFMDLFDMLDESAATGRVHIEVNWWYHRENEIALECGEEFQEDIQHLQFNLLEKAA